jgi:hypothetical protein
MKPSAATSNTQAPTTGNTHPQFPGPIGNPRAGKQARYSFKGGWHKEAIAASSPATKSLVGNPHK